MGDEPTVFENTYREYLDKIAGIDLLARASMLGAEPVEDGLVVPFYGKPYRISKKGVLDASGETANFAVSVVLCRYVLQCPGEIPDSGDWVTFREFKDAGPLVGYFATNTNKIIESTFAGNTRALEAAGRSLGGVLFTDDSSFDISVKFECLPRIPVLLRFNDRDEEFPAQCSILFSQSAEAYLDMECLAIGGTFLAGMLIGKYSST